MIVVDTSVLIDFLNGYITPPVNRLRTVIREETLLVGDIVLCEVLKGARGKAHARLLERQLQQFEWVRMLDARAHAAAFGSRLRSNGTLPCLKVEPTHYMVNEPRVAYG